MSDRSTAGIEAAAACTRQALAELITQAGRAGHPHGSHAALAEILGTGSDSIVATIASGIEKLADHVTSPHQAQASCILTRVADSLRTLTVNGHDAARALTILDPNRRCPRPREYPRTAVVRQGLHEFELIDGQGGPDGA
ncbi:hypothetical protein [Streptomyces sp. NEAU-S7GS2]|uniref:hypothetical protein n=1 Tax=Streptomyces sp. NEAU-S7GS2 TaxID=2202000 RepID=UPI000D6F9319|nr:hypothetical protein [Streptomyces sp. NEAU-S7GS2]AWN32611.1 hypothetical protein DKG71_42280 [Streptomyces sp. NEAU-S7GS2]